MLGSHEARGHHICAIRDLLISQAVWNRCQVCLCVVDVEILGHVAVFHVSKLPTAEHLGALRGIPAKAIVALEAGSNRIDHDTIPFLKALNCASQLVNHSYGLMPEGEVCPFSNCA